MTFQSGGGLQNSFTTLKTAINRNNNSFNYVLGKKNLDAHKIA